MEPSEALRLAMGQLGVHPSHPNPACIEKTFNANKGEYVITFQCPSCGAKSTDDGLSQPCAMAQKVDASAGLPPWGNWETEDATV